MVLDGVVDLAEPGVAGRGGQAVGLRAGARALQRLVRRRRRRAARSPPSDRRRSTRSSRPPRRAHPGQPAPTARPARVRSRSPWPRPSTAETAVADLAEAIARGPRGRRHRPGRGWPTATSIAARRQYPNASATYFAVNCLDVGWPDVDGVLAAAERRGRGYAALRRGPRQRLRPLQPLAGAARSRPAGRRPVAGSAAGPRHQHGGDPATPYESGVAVADHLATGVLLTYEGDGPHHRRSAEATASTTRSCAYLVDLVPPADGTRLPLTPELSRPSSPATSGSRVSSGCSPASRSSQ